MKVLKRNSSSRKRAKFFIVVFSIFTLLTIYQSPAKAELFVDLYSGQVNTRDADATVNYPPGMTATEKVNFGTSLVFGYRVGMWSERFPYLGFAGDWSYYRIATSDVKADNFIVSALLMVRYPLQVNSEYPHGKLQPYVGIGPGITYSDISVDLRPTVPWTESASTLKIELDIKAGVAWLFHPQVALFGEYRSTRINVKTDNLDTAMESNYFILGISIRCE